MGNYLGLPSHDSNDQEIEELKKRLSDLEALDRNGDGKISKDEMDIWIANQKKDLMIFEKSIDDKYQKVIKENEEHIKNIHELECYIDTLKHTNEQLKEELQTLKEDEELIKISNANKANKLRLSEMSKARIKEFVQKLLNDKNVNIKYLPDFVERQIYINVFNILINLLDDVLDTASIEFLGHKLTFDINPQDDDKEKK